MALLPSRFLKRPKSVLLKSMVVSLLCALINALRRILYSFMIAAAQAALELHVSHKPLLISEKKGN